MSTLRLDKWLWTSRLYKTRGLAREAIEGGKVELNGHRAKPAKTVQAGDRIRLTRGRVRMEVVVDGVSDRRLGPVPARELYTETDESILARQVEAERARTVSIGPPKRPSNRDRKRLADLKRRGDD